MQLKLGINTGFAINRFPEAEDWVNIVADELGLDTIQFTADLLNPFLPESLVKKQADNIRNLCDKKGINIESTFTSQFTRVNHLLHPDVETQRVWVGWFKKFIDLSAQLGAEGMGSHFGIMSTRDNRDPLIREKRIQQGIDAWRELAEYGAAAGLKYLTFEPMSVPREVAATLEETASLMERCEEGFAIPLLLCLDVDHGDLMSGNAADINPHVWLQRFARQAPQIHIKQSLTDKGGHYPFTPEYNAKGKIIPAEIIGDLRAAKVEKTTLLLEISHRERLPADERVVDDLKASVAYWKPALAAYCGA